MPLVYGTNNKTKIDFMERQVESLGIEISSLPATKRDTEKTRCLLKFIIYSTIFLISSIALSCFNFLLSSSSELSLTFFIKT